MSNIVISQKYQFEELVYVDRTVYDGKVTPDPNELDGGRLSKYAYPKNHIKCSKGLIIANDRIILSYVQALHLFFD